MLGYKVYLSCLQNPPHLSWYCRKGNTHSGSGNEQWKHKLLVTEKGEWLFCFLRQTKNCIWQPVYKQWLWKSCCSLILGGLLKFYIANMKLYVFYTADFLSLFSLISKVYQICPPTSYTLYLFQLGLNFRLI